MPDVYEGDRPYIFVSYAHADDDAVLPLLDALVAEGYRVWWDKGIELSAPFPQYIADHVYGCACFMPLLSRASLRSDWCNSEIYYALDLRKRILPVYLEDVELPRGLYMPLFYRQHLSRSDFDSDAALYKELFGTEALDACLTPEGARRRGVKARDPQAGNPRSEATTGLQNDSRSTRTKAVAQQPEPTEQPPKPVGPQGRSGTTKPSVGRATITVSRSTVSFEPTSSLAAYSWADLKELSHMIAAATSDAEGLAIAKSYCLVDKGGKLRGDEKPLQLEDGTKTSVRILGFRHDELASGGKSGISFEFADVPTTHRMNAEWTNAGGWEGSEMRRWLNSEFLALLPGDVRPLIEAARKRTNNKGRVSKNDTAWVTATADRLWLLSTYEVYGGVPSWMYSPATYGAEGTQYRLYAGKGVSIENYGFCRKKKDVADSWWWLRSPHAVSYDWFRCVYSDGGWHAILADSDGGVSPGFCL